MDSGVADTRYRVRKAELSDVPMIAEIGATAHAEMKPPFNGPIEWEKAIMLVCDVIEHAVALVVEVDGKVVGTLGLRLIEHEWTSLRYLGDVWIAVHSEHRTLGAFGALIRGAAAAAAPLGVPVVIGNMTLTDSERKNILFARYMQPIGALYLVGMPK